MYTRKEKNPLPLTTLSYSGEYIQNIFKIQSKLPFRYYVEVKIIYLYIHKRRTEESVMFMDVDQYVCDPIKSHAQIWTDPYCLWFDIGEELAVREVKRF